MYLIWLHSFGQTCVSAKIFSLSSIKSSYPAFSLHNNSCQLILSHLTCAHGRDKMSKASDMNGTLPCLLCGDAKKSDYLGLGEVTSHVQAHPLCIKFAKEIHNKKSIVGVG